MSEPQVAVTAKIVENDGHKDTTVHETVTSAVTHETVVPKRHEEATTAVDREVHQEHYHTSVLPIEETEVLPEKHEHIVHDVKTHEHKHGDSSATKKLLEEEKQKFKDMKTEAEAIVTHKEAPAVKGEHVHHHVHETIQPVVQKEIIIPTVVHTTIPIKEVHHNEAKHHTTTTLPPLSLAEFQNQGGSLAGRPARTEVFEGEPRAAGAASSDVTANGTAANISASATTGNEQQPGLPLARSPTAPQQGRSGIVKESQGPKEV